MVEVTLVDMQLGATLPGIMKTVINDAPDVLGVSATFGQHDLMTELLDAVFALPQPPLVVAGGSLTVRNEALLLDRYLSLLIVRGAGESTVQDVLAHWDGDVEREQIAGHRLHRRPARPQHSGTHPSPHSEAGQPRSGGQHPSRVGPASRDVRAPWRRPARSLPGLHELLFLLSAWPQGAVGWSRARHVPVDARPDGPGLRPLPGCVPHRVPGGRGVHRARPRRCGPCAGYDIRSHLASCTGSRSRRI
ncbi:hypothetical protein ACPCTO_36040 [Streptomyces olivoreticuli]